MDKEEEKLIESEFRPTLLTLRQQWQELDKQAKEHVEVLKLLTDAVKSEWSRLSDGERNGVPELTNDMINTYQQSQDRLAAERIASLEALEAQSEEFLAQQLALMTLRPQTQRDDLPRNVRLLVDANDYKQQKRTLRNRVYLIGQKIDIVAAAMNMPKEDEKYGIDINQMRETLKEVGTELTGAHSLLENWSAALLNKKTHDRLENFKRQIKRPDEEALKEHRSGVERILKSEPYLFSHLKDITSEALCDEKELQQRLGEFLKGANRVQALLRERSQKLSIEDRALLQAEWKARLWEALAESLAKNKSGGLPLSRIATRLFEVAQENSQWPHSWETELLVRRTEPNAVAPTQIPDRYAVRSLEARKELAASQVYSSLLAMPQEHQAKIEPYLQITWQERWKYWREELPRWSEEMAHSQADELSSPFPQSSPTFPAVLQLYRQWTGQPALTAVEIEKMQQDPAKLQALQVHSTPEDPQQSGLRGIQALEQVSQAQRNDIAHIDNAIDAWQGSHDILLPQAVSYLEWFVDLSEKLKDNQQKIDGILKSISDELQPLNTLSPPRNEQDLNDRILYGVESVQRVLPQTEQVEQLLSRHRELQQELKRTEDQISRLKRLSALREQLQKTISELPRVENDGQRNFLGKKLEKADLALQSAMDTLNNLEFYAPAEHWETGLMKIDITINKIDRKVNSLPHLLEQLVSTDNLDKLIDEIAERAKKWQPKALSESRDKIDSFKQQLEYLSTWIDTNKQQMSTFSAEIFHSSTVQRKWHIQKNLHSQMTALYEKVRAPSAESTDPAVRLSTAQDRERSINFLSRVSDAQHQLDATVKWTQYMDRLMAISRNQSWSNENLAKISAAMGSVPDTNADFAKLQAIHKTLLTFNQRLDALHADVQYVISTGEWHVDGRQFDAKLAALDSEMKGLSNNIQKVAESPHTSQFFQRPLSILKGNPQEIDSGSSASNESPAEQQAAAASLPLSEKDWSQLSEKCGIGRSTVRRDPVKVKDSVIKAVYETENGDFIYQLNSRNKPVQQQPGTQASYVLVPRHVVENAKHLHAAKVQAANPHMTVKTGGFTVTENLLRQTPSSNQQQPKRKLSP